MKNSIWKQLTSVNKYTKSKPKKEYPFTAAFSEDGCCIGISAGIKSFTDFPLADILNVVHRNGKVTVINKEV